MKKAWILSTALVFSGCVSSGVTYDETLFLTDGNNSIPVRVEIADTDAARERGLMGRTFLPDNTGMLFVFDVDQPLSFWMKDTLIPLDILYFRADGSLVSMDTMVPCDADPCQIYKAAEPAARALELPAGFAAVHGIGASWRLQRGK